MSGILRRRVGKGGIILELRHQVERLAARKHNVRAAELHAVLTRAGFVRRFGKGDHWVYEHPASPGLLVIDPRRRVKAIYVTATIDAIREVMRW